MDKTGFTKLISDSSDSELITIRCQIDAELAGRGIVLNVGAMGEKLCIALFNKTSGLPKLIQAPTGAKNVDALSKDGDRYSIKTALKAKKTGTIYPDEQNQNKQLFEFLVIVQLDNGYLLNSIHRFGWESFLTIRAWDKRMNAWYVPLSSKNLAVGEVIYKRNIE